MTNKNINNQLQVKLIEANEELAKFLESTKNELDIFFEFKTVEPLIFFLDSRKELDLIWGKETERWFVGAFKNNSIYIFNPEAYVTESSHKKEEFWITLKHEYCHACYAQITKSRYPVWLNEGLASYISGKKLLLTNDNREKLLNIFDYFDYVDKGAYIIGQFWVEFLIKGYGKGKFLKLIKSFSSKFGYQEFSEIFYSVYGFKFDKETLSKFID